MTSQTPQYPDNFNAKHLPVFDPLANQRQTPEEIQGDINRMVGLGAPRTQHPIPSDDQDWLENLYMRVRAGVDPDTRHPHITEHEFKAAITARIEQEKLAARAVELGAVLSIFTNGLPQHEQAVALQQAKDRLAELEAALKAQRSAE